MAKKILLIENDSAFAAGIAESLEASGYETRVTADGKDGLDLAREWGPQAVVLCVELQGMSGYLVCQKLKKDDALKGLPLVLTSAEATEETFEKHRTLKARADEYLLKPYAPAALLEKLEVLVGSPEGGGAEAGDVELVSLEEEIGLEATAEGSPDEEIPALTLDALGDEPVASSAGPGAEDEDLRLLDDAFDGIAAPAQDVDAALDELTGEQPMPGDEVDAAAASLPDEDEGDRVDLGALDDEADTALGALAPDETLSTPLTRAAPAAPVRGASADLLRAAGIEVLDEDEPPRAARPPDAERPGGARVERELAETRERLERLEAKLAGRDGQIAELTARREELEAEVERLGAKADAAAAQARKAEGEARAGREEARRAAEQAKDAEAELGELRRRLEEAERRAEAAEEEARRRGDEASAAAEAVAKAEALEREADELRTELLVARSEADGARGEVEKRTAELKKRVSELEATSAKNEERVVKAYQKIKADEKAREKVRKALAIAAQLLDEGLPADKDRRPANPVAAGRE